MEESQKRVRYRTYQSENNLAKQPYPELEAVEPSPNSDPGVVGMPERPLPLSSITENVPTPRVPAKTKLKGGKSRRQSQAAATPIKPIPFRQLRETNQQPLLDMLRRLETQAERINQILAERATSQPAPDLSPRSPNPNRSYSPAFTPPGNLEISELNTEVDDTADLQGQLAQINHLINQLLVQLESTMGPPTASPEPEVTHSLQPPAAPSPKVQPGVDRRSKPQKRSSSPAIPSFATTPGHLQAATDYQAEQDAAKTAQALRYLAQREALASLPDSPRLPSPRKRRAGKVSLKQLGIRLRQWLQIPQKPMDRVGDAFLWIAMATAVRVGTRFLTATLPAFSPLLTLLMLAPAALALYLVFFVPEAGTISMYRIFLIMLGLLLGGTL